MENKSATKGTGYNKMRLKLKGGGHNKGGGRTERGRKQKGTDPKISPCKKYVVMITAA
jgi:hypothetical protein